MRLIVTVFLLTTLCHTLSLYADASTEINDSDLAPEPASNPAIISTCEQIADAQASNQNIDREQFLRQCTAEAQQFLQEIQSISQSLSQIP